MTYKLLVTDLDGTLLDQYGRVHERDRQAIARLLKNGVRVAVCTGRMYSGTRDITRGLGLTGPVACVDGSHIVDAFDDRDLALCTIGPEAGARLFEVLTSHRPTTFVFAEDRIFHDRAGEAFLPYVRTWSGRAELLVDAIAHFGGGLNGSVAGLVSLGTEEQIRLSYESLSRDQALFAVRFELRRPEFRGLWGMVVRAAGVTKGTAVEWIARHYALQPSEVVAVGDWLNDIPMLQRAGRSFAMSHAPDEVKASATDQLEADAHSGGGIAEAAERSGLL